MSPDDDGLPDFGGTLKITGTGKFASAGPGSNLTAALMSAVAFCALPENFPAFHRWCMEVSNDNRSMANFLVTLSPAQLTLLVGGLTAGVGAHLEDQARKAGR